MKYAFVLMVLVAACSSSTSDDDRAPVIDSADAPASVTPTDTLYNVPFTLLWSDPDGDAVTKIRYRVMDLGIDRTMEAPDGGKDVFGAKLQVTLSGATAKRSYEFLFSAFDDKGLESVPFTRSVSLE